MNEIRNCHPNAMNTLWMIARKHVIAPIHRRLSYAEKEIMSVKLLKSKNDVAKAKPEVNCLNPRITGVARACRRGRLLYPFQPHATRNISPTLPYTYVDNQKQHPHQGSPTRFWKAYEASLRYHRFYIVNENKPTIFFLAIKR